jgi:hypothetical protein
MKGIYSRGNNKVVIILFPIYDKNHAEAEAEMLSPMVRLVSREEGLQHHRAMQDLSIVEANERAMAKHR